MSTGKRILLLVVAAVLALAAYILYPKPCVEYGGMLAPDAVPQPQCHCEGKLITVRDDAPADGLTIKKCIGLALYPSAVDAE